MKIKKQISIFIGILLIHQLLAIFIYNSISPIHFISQNFFFLELVGKRENIPFEILLIIDAGNLVLFWLIGRRLFADKLSLIPSLVYAISPWSGYLAAAGSFYIYILFLVLVGFYGLLILKSKKLSGSVLVIGATVVSVYSHFILFILLLIILCLPIFRIVSFKDLKVSITIIILLIIPLTFVIQKNYSGFKNIFNNEIKIFSDPGLLNTVNSFQGEAQRDGFGKLAKISENKYIFYSEYVGLKYTKQLIPTTYFTSQEKLLKFSFTPPILLGFLIPFLYGIYKLLLLSFTRRSLFLSTLLGLPSILSKQLVDLNRLIIFSPVIIFVISYGMTLLIKQKKEKRIYLFLILTISLILFQLVVSFIDINLREKDRFIKYFENEENYEIGKQ